MAPWKRTEIQGNCVSSRFVERWCKRQVSGCHCRKLFPTVGSFGIIHVLLLMRLSLVWIEMIILKWRVCSLIMTKEYFQGGWIFALLKTLEELNSRIGKVRYHQNKWRDLDLITFWKMCWQGRSMYWTHSVILIIFILWYRSTHPINKAISSKGFNAAQCQAVERLGKIERYIAGNTRYELTRSRYGNRNTSTMTSSIYGQAKFFSDTSISPRDN